MTGAADRISRSQLLIEYKKLPEASRPRRSKFSSSSADEYFFDKQLARFSGPTAGVIIDQAIEDSNCIIGSKVRIVQGSLLTLLFVIILIFSWTYHYYILSVCSFFLQYIGALRFRAGMDKRRQAAYDRRLIADVRRLAARATSDPGEQKSNRV